MWNKQLYSSAIFITHKVLSFCPFWIYSLDPINIIVSWIKKNFILWFYNLIDAWKTHHEKVPQPYVRSYDTTKDPILIKSERSWNFFAHHNFSLEFHIGMGRDGILPRRDGTRSAVSSRFSARRDSDQSGCKSRPNRDNFGLQGCNSRLIRDLN